MARLAFELSELSVLLVEDDSFARELEMTALHTIGIDTVTVAPSGEDGLLALESGGPFDLIVSDWNMRRFDGLQLLEIVRSRWPSLAFLMATNNEGLDQIGQAMDAGVDGYLIKPFSLEKLREMIQLALVTRRTISKSGKQKASPVTRVAGNDTTHVLENALAVVSDHLDRGTTPDSLDGCTPDTLALISDTARRLSEQLTWFIQSLEAADDLQLKIIQSHVDCIRAIQSGRADLLEHETRNAIFDGLNLAIDMVPR